jgi:hypothetical protein
VSESKLALVVLSAPQQLAGDSKEDGKINTTGHRFDG